MVDQQFTVKAPAHGYSYRAGDGSLHLSKIDITLGGKPSAYWLGGFFDGRGIAEVYRQTEYTSLRFAHDGRVHVRSWKRFFGDRTIARLSRAFITDVIAGTAA